MGISYIRPIEASALLKTESRVLLDVRTVAERMTACIEQSMFIPLHELPTSWQSLPKDKEIIVYCHHGSRSEQAAIFLQQHGFKAKSLLGGIEAWSNNVDPSVPRY